MDCNDVKSGLKVRIGTLGTTNGMTIHQSHLDCRAVGLEGIVSGFVPGHGGDVWFVEHGLGVVGAYCFTEFDPA